MKVFWKYKNEEKFKQSNLVLKKNKYFWSKEIPLERKGQWINLYIQLDGSAGRRKTAPIAAPLQTIDISIDE